MRNDAKAEYSETTTIFGKSDRLEGYLTKTNFNTVQRMQFYAIEIAR